MRIKNKTIPYRLIVAGDRDYTNIDAVYNQIGHYLVTRNISTEDLIIISGNCRGVDKIGESFANEYETGLELFPADWESYGRAAGPIRNEKMAKISNGLLAFLNKKSIGTKNMINQAIKRGLEVVIIDCESEKEITLPKV